MALPVDVHEQIAQREARLRLLPADETPPPAAMREQVRTWQEHVHEAAETIRWADTTMEQLAGMPGTSTAEREHALVLVRSVRAQALDLMQRLNPDQAWFWTEEWQAGEREADAEIAAGHTTFYASTDDFLAALDKRRASHAHT
jgi:hypothetical protein